MYTDAVHSQLIQIDVLNMGCYADYHIHSVYQVLLLRHWLLSKMMFRC